MAWKCEAAGVQASEGQVRVFAAGDDQVRGQVVEQESQGGIDWLGIKQVVIVKDENHLFGQFGDFVEHAGQQGFDGRRLGCLQGGQSPFA
jgi:hypothetical protein